MIAPLNLALSLTLIREGEKMIASGQTEAGLRVIGFGADHLQSFLPTPEPRIASERTGGEWRGAVRQCLPGPGKERWGAARNGEARHGTQSTRGMR